MIKSEFAVKDSTIYRDIPTLNAGLDEILELRSTFYKTLVGTIENQQTSDKSISRILMKFDVSAFSSSLASGTITSPKFYLKLYTTKAGSLQTDYTISVYPVSQSWTMGSGKTQSNPIVQDGVSWNYRNGITPWSITGSTWYTNYSASQTFSYETSDLNVDVTNIVLAWISGSIPNEGFLLKFSGSLETDSVDYGYINFFSRDTHTIYPPMLQVKWDDSSYSTGSLTAADLNNMAISFTNLKEVYKTSEVSKILILPRDRFISKTFVTSSRYLTARYLPTSSYYSVKDAHTEEVLIPFDENSTKLSCDGIHAYFNFDMSVLQPERYYKFVLKINQGNLTTVIDDKYYFKVGR